MSGTLIVTIILAIGVVGFFVARQRALALVNGGARNEMHSLPQYHGWWVLLVSIIPALLALLLWVAGSSYYIETNIRSQMATQVGQGSDTADSLNFGIIKSLADGLRSLDDDAAVDVTTYKDAQALIAEKGIPLAASGTDDMVPLALELNREYDLSLMIGGVGGILISLVGAFYGLWRVRVRTRARNNVEGIILLALIGASSIAILTTVGIVMSVLFQTISFFQSVEPMSFLFGTVWDPRFAAAGAEATEGQFGLIPLLAGTLYIALVAMLFAVPIGLFAAIYMAEYASASARSVVKPLLEVLAGIPTIVYGIFALVTVGPFLRDLSAALAGGESFIQAQSVLTAGLVMGIMLIPFVSSLSDDVINAVPQSLRDGSLGLGATKSETITRVILPAALPGVVGAILLTASRAIGETMIVVLAAGVAARLTTNPFEAMTTITVKIVSQLTGDLEFDSPQTLVAFALGLTLFVLTLFMNIFALYIVRKYQEQYE